MSFKDLPLEARPREKLIARGPAALGDAELLALLLRTGLAGKNVLQLAQELLDRFGGLSGLLHASLADLAQVKGLGGSAKRAEVAAVLELARRAVLGRQLELAEPGFFQHRADGHRLRLQRVGDRVEHRAGAVQAVCAGVVRLLEVLERAVAPAQQQELVLERGLQCESRALETGDGAEQGAARTERPG